MQSHPDAAATQDGNKIGVVESKREENGRANLQYQGGRRGNGRTPVLGARRSMGAWVVHELGVWTWA
jgi:hypothetical protein